MRLAELQAAFMANVLDEGHSMPAEWSERHAAGLNIYRGNYRTALVEALRDTYPKTQIWAGEAPFQQAAINHIIKNPSASWTIDDVGAGFDVTCAGFFKEAAEVAELAWLEWNMMEAFSAPDIEPLDLEEFGLAISAFDEEAWLSLQLGLVPHLSARMVDHDLNVMWKWMETDQTAEEATRPLSRMPAPSGVFVWREDERATFQMVAADEVATVHAVQAGSSYGEICVMLAGKGADTDQMQQAAMRAGAILRRWVQEGLVANLKT